VGSKTNQRSKWAATLQSFGDLQLQQPLR
jgi:hypothetical protein